MLMLDPKRMGENIAVLIKEGNDRTVRALDPKHPMVLNVERYKSGVVIKEALKRCELCEYANPNQTPDYANQTLGTGKLCTSCFHRAFPDGEEQKCRLCEKDANKNLGAGKLCNLHYMKSQHRDKVCDWCEKKVDPRIGNGILCTSHAVEMHNTHSKGQPVKYNGEYAFPMLTKALKHKIVENDNGKKKRVKMKGLTNLETALVTYIFRECVEFGDCQTSNREFVKMFPVSSKQLERMITSLCDRKYITSYVRDGYRVIRPVEHKHGNPLIIRYGPRQKGLPLK